MTDTCQKKTDRIDGARLLDVKAVARILGLSVWGVRHLHRKHTLRGKTQAGALRWHSDDVADYVERFRDE